MFNKKIMAVVIFVVSLMAISAVSATDNVTDIDDIKIQESDLLKNDDVLTLENDVVLSSSENEKLDGMPYYYDYKVTVSNVTYSYGSSGSIRMSITPAEGCDRYYMYDMYVVDSNNAVKIKEHYLGMSYKTYETYSIRSSDLEPGMYTIKIVNSLDKRLMASSKLTVKSVVYSAYSVSISNVSMIYGFSNSIQMSIKPASKNTYKYDYYLKVYDCNNVEKISQRYYSTSSSYSKTYSLASKSLDSGLYTIKIINTFDNMVMDTAKLSIVSTRNSAYSASVSDMTLISSAGGKIKISVTSASSSIYYYKHDFYLKIYDSNNAVKVSERFYSTQSVSSYNYDVKANQLSTGIYTIKIINNGDDYVMSTAKLTVVSVPHNNYKISVPDSSMIYGYEGNILMSVSPSKVNTYKYDFYLKVYDSKNVEKISKRYFGTGSTYSITHSIGSNVLAPGVYTIKILNAGDDYLMSTATLTVINVNFETHDVVGNCNEQIEYKVRISHDGKYKSGLKVVVTCDGKTYNLVTDENGYATLNIHLKAGTYVVSAKYEDILNKNTLKINPVLVENDYKNVYVKYLTAHYGGNNKVSYGWQGNLEGYFRIYKGNKLLYETKLNTNGYVDDYMQYIKHDGFYNGSKINAVGTYRAVICNVKGKQLASAQIKIQKASTTAVCYDLTSKIGARDSLYAGIFDKKNNLIKTSGKAQFKIFGKTYNVKLKNGFAYVTLKFPLKAKKYRGTFKFFGNSNYKASSVKFKIILGKKDVVILKKNRSVKVGKYNVKLSQNQYKSFVKAFNSGKSKSINIKTGYNYNFKVKYTKKVNKYKTTRVCKTWYAGSYLPLMKKMRSYGWKKVSEYTYTKKNPRNREGVGLSAYTYAVTKWVKTTYKTAYKTKSYPVRAYISYDKGYPNAGIEIYANDKTLDYRFLAIE